MELKEGDARWSRNVIYAAICMKSDIINAGHSIIELKDWFSKYRYNTKNVHENTELSKHFITVREERAMEVCILESIIFTEKEKEIKQNHSVAQSKAFRLS